MPSEMVVHTFYSSFEFDVVEKTALSLPLSLSLCLCRDREAKIETDWSD